MQHYSLVLNTITGSRRSIRINNPTVGLTTEEISDAVEQIIENDVFDDERGALVSVNRMELTTIAREVIL
jgi:hypothetical protein